MANPSGKRKRRSSNTSSSSNKNDNKRMWNSSSKKKRGSSSSNAAASSSSGGINPDEAEKMFQEIADEDDDQVAGMEGRTFFVCVGRCFFSSSSSSRCRSWWLFVCKKAITDVGGSRHLEKVLSLNTSIFLPLFVAAFFSFCVPHRNFQIMRTIRN